MRLLTLLGRALEDAHDHADAVNDGENREGRNCGGTKVADDGYAEVGEFSEERCHMCYLLCVVVALFLTNRRQKTRGRFE